MRARVRVDTAVRFVSLRSRLLRADTAYRSEGLHFRSVLVEAKLVESVELDVRTDTSSAKVHRETVRGFAQDKTHSVALPLHAGFVRAGVIKITKVKGELNPADVFTKFVYVDVLRRHIRRIGLVTTNELQIHDVLVAPRTKPTRPLQHVNFRVSQCIFTFTTMYQRRTRTFWTHTASSLGQSTSRSLRATRQTSFRRLHTRSRFAL